jgi:hypothetical protein
MNISHSSIWLPALLALALSACGDSSDPLAPETADGDAPSYEQLNPPAPGDSSTAPAAPGDQRQEETTIPLPGQGGESVVPEDGSVSPSGEDVTSP